MPTVCKKRTLNTSKATIVQARIKQRRAPIGAHNRTTHKLTTFVGDSYTFLPLMMGKHKLNDKNHDTHTRAHVLTARDGETRAYQRASWNSQPRTHYHCSSRRSTRAPRTMKLTLTHVKLCGIHKLRHTTSVFARRSSTDQAMRLVSLSSKNLKQELKKLFMLKKTSRRAALAENFLSKHFTNALNEEASTDHHQSTRRPR